MSEDPFELLGAAYFHQDWDEESSTPRGVVEQFALENPELVRPTLDRILQLKTWPESELARYLEVSRFHYDPRPTGTTYVEWLEAIERWLNDSAHA